MAAALEGGAHIRSHFPHIPLPLHTIVTIIFNESPGLELHKYEVTFVFFLSSIASVVMIPSDAKAVDTCW